MKIAFIIVLVVMVAIGFAIYNSAAPDQTLFRPSSQPRITPELAIDVAKVSGSNWIYLTATKPGANLPDLGGDIAIKILRGSGGGVYRAKDYGPAGGLTYSFQGTGGDYRLELTFAHPDKWPEELALKIEPSP